MVSEESGKAPGALVIKCSWLNGCLTYLEVCSLVLCLPLSAKTRRAKLDHSIVPFAGNPPKWCTRQRPGPSGSQGHPLLLTGVSVCGDASLHLPACCCFLPHAFHSLSLIDGYPLRPGSHKNVERVFFFAADGWLSLSCANIQSIGLPVVG